MFASEWGRKMFVRSVYFSWLGLLLPWFSFYPEVEGYILGIFIFPKIMIQMACLIVIWNNEPERRLWKVIVPILTEVLLISFPILYFWQMMTWYYPVDSTDNYLATGLSTAYSPFWVAFALTFIPILAFPILRRWKFKE